MVEPYLEKMADEQEAKGYTVETGAMKYIHTSRNKERRTDEGKNECKN